MSRHHGIVKEFLDTTFGEVTSIGQLSNAREIYNQLLFKQRDLENRLSVISTEVPTKIEKAIRQADGSLSQADDLISRKNDLVHRIHSAVEECQPLHDDLSGMVFQESEIKKYISYLQWLETIEKLSGEIQQCILSGSLSDACRAFTQILKIDRILIEQNSKCESLLKYTAETLLFWNKILKEKLASELDDVLKKIGWPFVLAPGAGNIPKVVPAPSGEKRSGKIGNGLMSSVDLGADFERVFVNLLLIQLPDHLLQVQSNQVEGSNQSAPVTGNHILLPLQLLVRPLRKRFRYHFYGNKQTNSIGKPEWYLTQILNWVGNHQAFLEVTVQPILDNRGHKNVDALVMFTRGLLQLVCRKLSEDMNELLDSDDHFSHTVDEILLFDRELRGSHDFSPLVIQEENPLNVFMSAECIQKWIGIEKTCALDRVDDMWTSSNAWESQYGVKGQHETESTVGERNFDETTVPECAESFITMLLTITDRYKHIPSTNYQLQFLDLQLHLLDDFRIRLAQILKTESSDSPLGNKHFAVLNAAYYIAVVLREWAENPFFLELKHKRDEESGGMSGNNIVPQSLLNLGERRQSRASDAPSLIPEDSVFDGLLRLYDRLYKDGLVQVAKIVCTEFEIKGWTYVSESWLTLPSKDEQLTLVVSRTACAMLLVLQEKLHLLSSKICSPMFSSCWRKIAEQVDSFLFHEVVLRNRFNVGGAIQLQFDMTRNLFPLFSPYTQKPENYFRRMKEACILLNLQDGSAMLLNEVLHTPPEALESHDPMIVKPTAALSDLGISLLQPEDALAIMKLRVDWLHNNM